MTPPDSRLVGPTDGLSNGALYRPKEAGDLCFLSACDLVAAYQSKALSPVEVTRRVLERIETLNPQLNAYFQIDGDGAMAAARAAEARWQRGQPAGALDGVPVSIKDHLQTAGLAHPRGSLVNLTPSTFDCPPVARLRESGAVILGKTTMPELSVIPVTESVAFGVTRNPWHLDHSPGGSSGGAAAAVAAGLGPLAIGTDGGGSIRLPASFTGLVGFKPTLGRVPYYPGETDRTVAGPIARTARDAALMMNVIARPDGRDWMELPRDDTDYVAALGGDLTGLRVAISPTFGFVRVAPMVLEAFETAAERFASLGAKVTLVESVGFDAFDIYMIQATLRLRDTAAALRPEERSRLPSAVTSILKFAAGVSAADVQTMIDRRNQLGDKLLRLFQDYDVIVSPAAPTPAPPIGQFYPDADAFSADGRNLIGFACPFNLVHMPAVSIPWDLSPEGLPIGLQIAGPKFSDALLLRMADALATKALNAASQAADD